MRQHEGDRLQREVMAQESWIYVPLQAKSEQGHEAIRLDPKAVGANDVLGTSCPRIGPLVRPQIARSHPWLRRSSRAQRCWPSPSSTLTSASD